MQTLFQNMRKTFTIFVGNWANWEKYKLNGSDIPPPPPPVDDAKYNNATNSISLLDHLSFNKCPFFNFVTCKARRLEMNMKYVDNCTRCHKDKKVLNFFQLPIIWTRTNCLRNYKTYQSLNNN